jgi:hypothetical protein
MSTPDVWVVEFENGDTMKVTAMDEESAVVEAYKDGSHDGIGHWGAYREQERN